MSTLEQRAVRGQRCRCLSGAPGCALPFPAGQVFVPYRCRYRRHLTDLDGDNTAGIDSDEDGLLNYGLGFKYFFTESAAVRAEVRHIFDFQDELEENAFNNLSATAGLFMQFGASQPALVAAAMPKDTDGDGVVDQFDRCPGTLLGVPVDGYGCPSDSDRDGVLDYLDACPGTPAGTAVEQNGCPPQTRVEARHDGDGDGVEDARDKCPNTPADIPVNSSGCPRDNDGDGVFDFEDRCPGTPKGAAVDATGCPMPPRAVTPTAPSLTLHLEFAYGEAAVRPEFARELQAAADFIKAHPGSRILIEGHTDSIGSAEANFALSEARAAEVLRYLVEKYNLDAGRIETEGFGEARPVADNATPEGRLRNRRVVIKVLPGR
jgi:OOP family OmpA-OmpF porin